MTELFTCLWASLNVLIKFGPIQYYQQQAFNRIMLFGSNSRDLIQFYNWIVVTPYRELFIDQNVL